MVASPSIAARYAAAVAAATAGQLNRSRTRRSGPVRQRVPLGGGVEQPAQRGRELLDVARRDQVGARRRPTTSGIAPVRLATSGVPEAISSAAGSEKPS